MSPSLASPRPLPRTGPLNDLALAFFFWVFTYGLLSWRAELVLGPAADTISLRRIAATSVGALIYLLVMHRTAAAVRRARPFRFWPVIATIVPASLIVLAVYLITDRLFSAAPQPLDVSLMFILTWAAYFGLWVCGTLAFQLRREAAPARAAAIEVSSPVQVAPAATVHPDAWTWLIDAAAAELAAAPAEQQEAIIAGLLERSSYELADESFADGNNARRELVMRLAAQVEARRKRRA